jgi:hypothetical protein
MHANLSVTDGVYGVLSENDLKEQIATLGKMSNSGGNQDLNTLITILEQALTTLKTNKGS